MEAGSVGAFPHLNPLPGNGEAGLLCQVGGAPLVGCGAFPEGPHGLSVGAEVLQQAAACEAVRQLIGYPRLGMLGCLPE